MTPLGWAIVAALPPTLATVVVILTMRRDAEVRARHNREAITAREALRDDVDAVRTLVNGNHDVQIDTIRALKREIARLNREGTPTPIIEAGQGAPSEVGIDHGVVTAERKGPFPPKTRDT